jgi:hypothetical protein
MTDEPIDSLLLVYNADAGRVAAFLDSARKALSIGACTLCELTHGLFGERSEWAECRLSYRVPVTALHRDEVDRETAAVAGELPAVLARSSGRIVPLVTARQLARCENIEALDRVIRASARESGLSFPE